jgi:hypothetical protein
VWLTSFAGQAVAGSSANQLDDKLKHKENLYERYQNDEGHEEHPADERH